METSQVICCICVHFQQCEKAMGSEDLADDNCLDDFIKKKKKNIKEIVYSQALVTVCKNIFSWQKVIELCIKCDACLMSIISVRKC